MQSNLALLAAMALLTAGCAKAAPESPPPRTPSATPTGYTVIDMDRRAHRVQSPLIRRYFPTDTPI